MSLYKKKIDEMCVNKYNLSNILDNDFDAIVSNLYFIQDREPTSMYVNLVWVWFTYFIFNYLCVILFHMSTCLMQ